MNIQNIISVSVAVLLATPALRSQEKKEAAAPKTKLEAFESRTGSVLIKGFADTGMVVGNGSVEISVREFTDATSGKREYGIVIEVKGMDRTDRKTRALIDYDELDGLVKGIDYVRKIDRSITKLENFEAIYSTRDGVKITVFSSTGGKIEAAVETGRFSGSAFFSLQKLDELRGLIAKAKLKIDSLKKA